MGVYELRGMHRMDGWMLDEGTDDWMETKRTARDCSGVIIRECILNYYFVMR